MPSTRVNVETNFEDGIKTAARLSTKMPESADDAATIIAQHWISEAQRTLQKHGNVVTGTGIRSFETISLGNAKKGVLGADYLQDLETGTGPHHPDTDNHRFIRAARSYGMTRQALAETIAEKGTRPHPWMEESTDRIRKTANERIKISYQKAAEEALTLL